MEEEKVIIDGLTANYKTFGAKTDPPVLILHGWGIGSDAWVEIGQKIAHQGYWIVIPDMPGFGKTPPPAQAWNFDDYLAWIKNFAQAIKLNEFILIGHSFGGALSAKFAAVNPQMTIKLVLCAAAVIRRQRLGFRQKIAQLLAKNKKIGEKLSSRLYFFLRKIVYQIGGAKDYAAAQGVMVQVFKNVAGYDSLKYCRQIIAPTLIIWGDKDRETPLSDADEINKAIAGSKLEIIKGAGHKLHRTHSQILAQKITEFIK